MILGVRVNNFLVYSNEAKLSLKADMRIKKFKSNIYSGNGFNIVKSLCIYGANNVGKTCLIRAVNSIKNVLLGDKAEVPYNIYTGSNVCSFGISFSEGEKAYSYDFKYDSSLSNRYKKGFTFECLKEINVDKYNNLSEKTIFIRDTENNKYKFIDDEELSKVLKSVSNDNILIYTINAEKYPVIEKYRSVLRNFADKIDILDMNNIPVKKTISVFKNNEKIKEKTIELIKSADLGTDDFGYPEEDKNISKSASTRDDGFPIPNENSLKNIPHDDMFRLTFDSTGTKKFIAISSYIVDALINGRILVVDDLDSSLHFKLTRAIVALFNNVLNNHAQLIFTAHDATLLDCKKLFRKDQIRFAAKDNDSGYLYSLADFTTQEDKIRSDSDLFEKYNSGVFGALPEPDFISVLLSDFPNDGDK